MSDIRYEFIMSQIKHIRDIKENEKTKISLVYYEGCQGPCILKICKNRDLSEVYQALMEVRHPNVAIVYDCIYENGNTYVIEEFITGKTLADILEEKGTFSEKETAGIMTELCKGLDVLHRQEPPIIHNDIKTSNIMIKEDGGVKLFDFDISRIYKEGSYKNTKLMGTHEYAAPEHYGFGQSDPRTDIYSLGVTMHEMLTGVGLNQEHNVTYQGGLAKILRKCVEIDRKKRYASAALLKSAIEKQKENDGHRWGIILACICGVLLFLLCGVLLYNHLNGKPWSQVIVGLFGNEFDEGSETDNDEKSTGMLDDNSQENSEIKADGNTEGDLETEGIENTEGILGTEGGLGIGGNGGIEGSTVIGENTGSGGNSETGGGSGMEDTSQPEDDSTQEGTSEENNDTGVPKKSYQLIYDPKDILRGMVTWANGTAVTVEEEKEVSGKYWLRSADGKETSLEGLSATKGVELACSPYTDQVYLFMFNISEHSVYSVNKNLEIEFIKTFDFSGEAIYEDILFYPDGTIGYTYHNKLIDSKDWTQIGNISSSQWRRGTNRTFIINDKVYTIETSSTGAFEAFLEWDSDGNLVKEYPKGDFHLLTSYNFHTERDFIYASGDALYARATVDGESVLVRFDGETYEVIAYFKDYEDGENRGPTPYVYVTDTAFGMYDVWTGGIIEFPLE